MSGTTPRCLWTRLCAVFILILLTLTTWEPAAFAQTSRSNTAEQEPYRSTNFTVYAATPDIAERVGKEAEHWRKELSIVWLGKEMPSWYRPCPIKVSVTNQGAGGMTTFSFDRGEVFGWNMQVQGTMDRILDSVIPHEVTHTILACHFRRPLPRWADEGACTLIEHDSEKLRQLKLLDEVMQSGKRIPLRQLFSMTEYPKDMNNVMKLYAEGYSVADFLVQQGGPRKFLAFMDQAHQQDWDTALKTHYQVNSIEDLEKQWSGWTLAGSPRIDATGQMVARAHLPAQPQQTTRQNSEPIAAAIIRGQSPESTLSSSSTSSPQPTALQAGEHSLADSSSPVVNVSGKLDRSALCEPLYLRGLAP